MDRRRFLRLAAGAATLAAGSACSGKPSRSTSAKVAAAKPKLRILQWTHFIPAYDQWFDGFATRWGEEHDTDVTVDHVTADDVRLRASAELSNRQGHDLLAFTGTPTGALEDDVIDHRDIVAEIEEKVGPMLPAIARGVHNPKTGRYVGVSDGWAAQVVNYRSDLWPAGGGGTPDSWESILRAAPRLKAAGAPVGIGLSPNSIDSQTTCWSLLFAFGASLQDEAGVLTLDSPAAVEAVKFGTSLYRSGMSHDILSWDNVSDNRFLASGKGSLIIDPVAALRATEKQDPDLAAKIALAPPPSGPAGRPGHIGVVTTYVVSKYAETPTAAGRFLVDLVLGYREAALRSEFYTCRPFPGRCRTCPIC
ncbi:MAG TPA: extracellular solute-binding protein [Acidimicrobiia bacterium]|nr:extracellular solute-binding protein [Acidimicrobiia bacterium]